MVLLNFWLSFNNKYPDMDPSLATKSVESGSGSSETFCICSTCNLYPLFVCRKFQNCPDHVGVYSLLLTAYQNINFAAFFKKI
jgi:hypothetical protein